MVALRKIKDLQRFYDFMVNHYDEEYCPLCGRRHSFNEFLMEIKKRENDAMQYATN